MTLIELEQRLNTIDQSVRTGIMTRDQANGARDAAIQAYRATLDICAHPFVLKSRAMSLGDCPICLRAEVERLTQERDFYFDEVKKFNP